MATIELPDTTVAVLQRIRAGWLPHKLSDGSWWWGRPSADDGFKLWHQGLVPTMSIVEPMNDDDKAVWTASLHPYAPERQGPCGCPPAAHCQEVER